MDKIEVLEIRLTRGTPLRNVYIDTEAPFIAGFVAIRSYIPEKIDDTHYKNIPATRYINLSHIEEMTLLHETLEDYGTYYIDPERPHKVRVEK